ncbi:hypothetical protein Tco_1490301, partial [Tanacetum coccineum]
GIGYSTLADATADMAPLPAADQRHPCSDTRLRSTLRGLDIDSAVRLRMLYSGDGQQVMSDTEMGLDIADTLCFQLGGVRKRMTWRQFILVSGLHTEQEMAEVRFRAYLAGSDKWIPDKRDLRDYWIEISSDRDFLGLAPSWFEKVTGVDLFYLRSMDHGTTNVPHLLARYLFRHAEGRKSRARLLGEYFIGRLAMHFWLVND